MRYARGWIDEIDWPKPRKNRAKFHRSTSNEHNEIVQITVINSRARILMEQIFH